MAAHLTSLNPSYQKRLGVLQKAFAPNFSPVDALHRAQASIYNVLLQQADYWAYMDIFYVMTWISAVCVLGVILFKNAKSSRSSGDALNHETNTCHRTGVWRRGQRHCRKDSQRLGWKLLDQELTAEIARLAKVHPDVCQKREERIDPWTYRLAKVFWRGSHERSVHLNDADILDADRLVCLSQQVVEQAAVAGQCVIVGRGGAIFSARSRRYVLRFPLRSRELKFQRVRLRIKNDTEAINLVDTVDQERAEFIQHYFKVQWPSRHLYHAMLNTDAGVDETVNTILYLMDAANKKAGGDSA
jgi:hypothetical protein